MQKEEALCFFCHKSNLQMFCMYSKEELEFLKNKKILTLIKEHSKYILKHHKDTRTYHERDVLPVIILS